MKALARLRTSAPAAVAMCLLYLTQQSVALAQARRPLPTIGALYTATCTSSFFQGFIKGLADLGYEDGKNVHIECRAAGGKVELLPGLAAELVQLKVDALLVGSCEAQFDAARHATSDIPIIVSACNDDLVANGVVGSLAHPGGNITGLSKITPELTAKRLEILQQLVPTATQIAVLWNSQVSASAQDWKELQSAAKLLKLDLYSIEATGPTDFAAAFKRAADLHVDAMITFSDGMTFQYAKDIASFALKYWMPVISPFREAPPLRAR
jgi:putative ABC transport system substrate-binding protein